MSKTESRVSRPWNIAQSTWITSEVCGPSADGTRSLGVLSVVPCTVNPNEKVAESIYAGVNESNFDDGTIMNAVGKDRKSVG